MSSMTPSMALDRMRKFCSYQDRSHSEVRTKLLKLHVYGDDLEEVISQLVNEDFLNEERFARSYVRGKFRMNKWGKFKIRMHLKQKRVSVYCIDKGMEEISEEEYLKTIDDLLTRKLAGNTDFKSKQRARDSLMRKGFEPAVISQRIAIISGS
jgi:regulatory protein